MNHQKFHCEHEKIIEELQSSPEYFIKSSLLQSEISDKKKNILHKDVGKSFRHPNDGNCPYGCIYAIQKTLGRIHGPSVVNSEEELQLTLQYKLSSQSDRYLNTVL